MDDSKYVCPECRSELRKRAPNILANMKRRKVGSPLDRFVCLDCRETFPSHEIEWEGEKEVWFDE